MIAAAICLALSRLVVTFLEATQRIPGFQEGFYEIARYLTRLY